MDEALRSVPPRNPGQLNYCLTRLCIEYAGSDPNYERLNAIIGALEACKLEFYRRMVAPYEDAKVQQNGDVYPQRET
jgi:hypothetical protein